MRNSPSRSRDAIKNGKCKKTIVVCVPSLAAHFGLPFLGPTSISAAANIRAVEVLRREVRVAASTGGAEGMNDIKVVSFEVGAFDISPFTTRQLLDYDPREYTKSWTPSEKLAYGPAWELLVLQGVPSESKGKGPKVELLVGDLVQIVSRGRVCSVSLCGLQVYVGSALDWLRGGRYILGSGGNYHLSSSRARLYLADICTSPLFPRSYGDLNFVTPSWRSARPHRQHSFSLPFRFRDSIIADPRNYTCCRAGASTRTRATSRTRYYSYRSSCSCSSRDY
jgi:hypothetical protein